MPSSPDALYKFLLELWNRTGGYKPSTQDLTGLKVTVSELNTLQGIHLDTSVQAQLNGKENAATLGDMAFQQSNNINVLGGRIENVDILFSQIDACTENNCQYSNVNINSGTVRGTDVYISSGSQNSAIVSGTLSRDFLSHHSVGVVETNLSSYSILANTMVNNGDYIEIIGFGSFASNANNKQIKLILGSTLIYDTTALAVNGGAWKITAIISRISSIQQKCIIEISSKTSLLTNSATYITASENLAADLIVKFTGTGVNDSDIIQEGMIIKYYKE